MLIKRILTPKQVQFSLSPVLGSAQFLSHYQSQGSPSFCKCIQAFNSRGRNGSAGLGEPNRRHLWPPSPWPAELRHPDFQRYQQPKGSEALGSSTHRETTGSASSSRVGNKQAPKPGTQLTGTQLPSSSSTRRTTLRCDPSLR